MRQCPNCGKPRAAHLFYPDAATNARAWCKRCIDRKRGKTRDLAVEVSQKLLREQAAMCAVVDAHQPNGEPFIYLLSHDGAYKIGYSTSVSTRVRTFNTAHSKPVQIVAVMPGGRSEEAKLHDALKHCRIAREWYRTSLEVLRAFTERPDALVFRVGHITEEAPPTLAASA